ncbi:MAG TPA: chromate efflux transporter [Acidimicrobiia bacterium]|nr:chromate efflux transporter [Acidimicrobiia bacterium]
MALARLFGRLSLTAFGGPAAHIALMQRELVEQREWLTAGEFLDLVGASNAIPGPTSTEVAMYTGRRHGGIPGLVVAGLGFIAPAALIVGVLAWVYVRYGTTPAVGHLLVGVKPVVLAVVSVAVVRLSRTALTSRLLAGIGVAVLAAYLAGLNEPVLLLAASAAAAIAGRPRRRRPGGSPGAALLALLAATGYMVARPLSAGAVGPGAEAVSAVAARGDGPDLLRILGAFLKIGALLFGSGYVLLAFLRRDLVLSHGWLTEGQILDAIAVGQFTPGPLFTTATFVGYLLRGVPGATVATVAIFLPAFVMTAVLEPVIVKLRNSPATAAALDGLNAAAVALMAGVTWFLGRDAVVGLPTALLAGGALVALLRWRVNPVWLMAAGAAAGLVLRGHLQ